MNFFHKKHHLIKEGRHYESWHGFGFTFGSELRAFGKFEDSCLYSFGDADDSDINKLFGFSEGINPHKNSARIGWRPNGDGKIDLIPYVYVDGKRDFFAETQVLTSVYPGDVWSAVIKSYGDRYTLSASNGTEGSGYTLPKSKKSWIKIYQYPYFGGNRPAPHDVRLELTFY